MGPASAKEKKMDQKLDHAAVVVNPILIYLGLAAAAILLQRVFSLPIIPAAVGHVLGIIFLALNFGFGLTALIGMVRVKTSPNPDRPSTTLVMSGPYRFTRNPMYFGLTLLFAGLLTFFQISWGLLLIPLVIWLITAWVIIPEEKYMQEKFGEEYLIYKSKVRRWI